MVQILDTTLRDGSYVVDFKFSIEDTEIIASGLDKNNVEFIEIGHGLGLSASRDPKMCAAHSDVEYMEAASRSIVNSKWGMFIIPGIGRLEDIVTAAEFGMDFIRIGTNVTEVDKSLPYITKAKEYGLYVFNNFMKTYAMTPDEVGKMASKVAAVGSDIVCIVDSAGGMLPEDVEDYFKGIRKYSDIEIGFHGHNNLGLAIANSLKAVELGASIVDCSIRGIGRSAGNAPTEILLYTLIRKGIHINIDPLKIMDIAETVIDPILRNRYPIDSYSVVSGYAQFHSSFLNTIMDYANRYGVDPRELIIYVCQEDKVSAPQEMVERIARNLANSKEYPGKTIISKLHFKSRINNTKFADNVISLAKEASAISKKYDKVSVFNI
ncbi:MAG: 4-hydroxy-2-oxovalerate aldolase, partial [Elusimicrobiota bacterium]|nr:4-hydroxy-2-oxovalerate aldolase [Elusimicrobiota bacterium]